MELEQMVMDEEGLRRAAAALGYKLQKTTFDISSIDFEAIEKALSPLGERVVRVSAVYKAGRLEDFRIHSMRAPRKMGPQGEQLSI